MTPIRKTGQAMLLVLSLGLANGLQAQVPNNLSYQGLLADSTGQTVSGPVLVEFALYAVDNGGVPLWSETQTVTAADGVFSAVLGEGQMPFPIDLFDGPLFLGITIESDVEMTPRSPLTSSAFSHKAQDADTLGGVDASQLDQSAAVSTLTTDLATVTSGLATTQTDVTQLQTDVTAVESDISELQIAESDITQLQTDVTAAESNITQLQTDVTAAEADIDQLQGAQSDITQLQSDVTAAESNISQLQTDVNAAESDVSQLQVDAAATNADVGQLETDLTATQSDVTAVENTLPTLQPLVTQFCASGSSIRSISGSGTVTCETDDAGPWLTNSISAPYVTGTTRIGVGTSAPAAALQIDAAIDTDPFRARVQSSTKLRVHTNGSVSVGTSSAGQENGLYVLGPAGFGTTSPGARLSVADPNWQLSLDNTDTGGNEWFMGSSADAWQSGGGKLIFAPTNSSGNAALTIDSAKNVGIGTFNPATRLHVTGGSDVNAAGGGFLVIGNTTSSHIAMDNNEIMGRNNGFAAQLALNAEGGLVTVNSGGNVNDDAMDITGSLRIDSGQNSGVIIGRTTSSPTNSVIQPTGFEEGLVGFSGAPFWRMYSSEFYASSPIEYRTYSDRSLKRNVVKIPAALDTIMALEGVTYELLKHPMNNKKDSPELSDAEKFTRDHQLGFIAQDLELVLPQLVKEDEETGLKTVGYMGLIPVLVEALKEQQRQIDAQWDEIELLREQLQ